LAELQQVSNAIGEDTCTELGIACLRIHKICESVQHARVPAEISVAVELMLDSFLSCRETADGDIAVEIRNRRSEAAVTRV
jgi:hypothetical protein